MWAGMFYFYFIYEPSSKFSDPVAPQTKRIGYLFRDRQVPFCFDNKKWGLDMAFDVLCFYSSTG